MTLPAPAACLPMTDRPARPVAPRSAQRALRPTPGLRPFARLLHAVAALSLASVLAPGLAPVVASVMALMLVPALTPPARAQPAGASAGLDGSTVIEAREAARRRDLPRLAAAKATLQASGHPLTPWAEYWELNLRLKDATVDEVEAFYARWPGSYVEDRLRNDWLLELGRRRDFGALARDFPRFRMNDDREVTCYALLADHLAGRDVAEPARRAWFAQREADDGCLLLAATQLEARRFQADDVWRKARLALEAQRPGVAKSVVALLGGDPATANASTASGPLPKEVAEAIDNPAAFLRKSGGISRSAHELRLLAVMRLSLTDLDAAIAQLADNRPALTRAQLVWAWAYVARQAAFKMLPDAALHVQRGWQPLRDNAAPDLSDETLGWGVRALLRAPTGLMPAAQRWRLVLRHIDSMSRAERSDANWQFWRARALNELAQAAGPGTEADTLRAEARTLLEGLAGPLGFYPSLAADELGQRLPLPAPPAPLQPAEREAAARHPGLQRAQLLGAIGLRDEARREWNFSLRGMDDRQINAAARLACDAGDWQLCINTAERTRTEVDLSLRYPMPYMAEIQQIAQQGQVEPALVLGIIRQETRFMPQLRSSAGATGLMQVMPETGRIVARKIGLDLGRNGALADPVTNLRLGTAYLRMMLDDFGGSQAMTAAGYNAGPGRPRRWREAVVMDAAAWTECIPFHETRDYVKKVLSNAAVYGALLDARKSPAVRPRLGERIGPRAADAPPVNTELP